MNGSDRSSCPIHPSHKAESMLVIIWLKKASQTRFTVPSPGAS